MINSTINHQQPQHLNNKNMNQKNNNNNIRKQRYEEANLTLFQQVISASTGALLTTSISMCHLLFNRLLFLSCCLSWIY